MAKLLTHEERMEVAIAETSIGIATIAGIAWMNCILNKVIHPERVKIQPYPVPCNDCGAQVGQPCMRGCPAQD